MQKLFPTITMTKSYYEKYWQGVFDKEGVMNKPPEFAYDDFIKVFDFIKRYCGKNILDVGAGDGTFTYNLVSKLKEEKKDTKIVALELAKRAIKIGTARYPKIKFIEGDVLNIPFQNNVFDTIIAIEVVEHVLDVNTMFAEFNRTLKKNGYLIITTTDFNLLKKLVVSLLFWDKFFYPTNPHIRFFTKNSLTNIAKKHNFCLIKHCWNKSYFNLMPLGQIAVFQKK